MPDDRQIPIDLGVELDPLISYAASQNAIPTVRELRVTNRTSATLFNLSIVVRLEPDIAPVWQAPIPTLAPEATHVVSAVPLALDHARLMNLNERERGRCHVSVLQNERPLVGQVVDVELLAYNEWRADTLPQLLTTFVQPNHPVVAETLNLARNHLQLLTGDPALEGYQSRDPVRVKAIAQSIYQTIQELGITYANPPASFRGTGQKVRTPEQVLTHQVGTCLDLALFYAACLEQVGLGSLIVVLDRHAYAGAWLDKDHPASVLWDDAAMVRNEIDAGKLLLVDSSTMAHRPAVQFDRAVSTGRSLLSNQFDYMIDVGCARAEKILPLPARVETGRFQAAPEVVVRAEPLDAVTEKRVRELLRAAEAGAAETARASKTPELPENVKERLERWRSRLLDLSLRNGLLNVRLNRVVTFISPDLALLEDELARGEPFTVHPRVQAFSENDPRSAEIYKAHRGADALAEIAEQALKGSKLLTHLDDDVLAKRLTDLARSGRTSMEEGGVHTIYLGLGMLSWYESESSENARLAPILLIPVELKRESARHRYQLSLADEEAIFNVTLLEKLRQDFGIDIPELSAELPQDDAGLDVPAIFNLVRNAIRGMRRWEVKHDAVLAQFSFSKLLMWRDLGTNAHHLVGSPVVRHLAQGGKEAFAQQGAFPAEERLDQDVKLAEFPCPKDADSSQLVAIEAGRTGKSFVLQGPPGTGKSQTITNLIAATLAQGKTVLFVSEKMAALEVVHDRLKQVGLSNYCLELHSNKAKKKELVEQLGAALDAERSGPPAQWNAVVDDLSQAGATLNGYVSALHAQRRNGFSAFHGFASLAGLHQAPHLALNLGAPSSLTRERLKALESTVRGLTTALDEAGDFASHPFRASKLVNFDPSLSQRLPELCSRALTDLAELREATAAVQGTVLGGAAFQGVAEMERFAVFAAAITTSERPPLALLRENDVTSACQQLHAYANKGERRDALTRDLATLWEAAFFELDLQGLVARFRQWSAAFFLLAFFMLWGARSTLRRVVRSPKLPGNRELLMQLEHALEVRGLQRDVESAASRVDRWVSSVSVNAPDSWARIAAHAKAAATLRERAGAAQLSPTTTDRLLQLASGETAHEPVANHERQLLTRFAQAWRRFSASRNDVLSSAEAEHDAVFGGGKSYFDRVEATLQQWRAQPQKLRALTQIRKAEAAAASAGLGPIAEGLLDARLRLDEALPALRRTFHTAWLNDVVREDAVLNAFSVRRHAEEIQRFAKLDFEYIATAGQLVAGELAKRLPKGGGTSGEVGILRRELHKQRKHLPIRLLFEKIPTLIRRLKPCLLMSPLSVAQYLRPGQEPFDLVVFDEASQIPVPDAIGAIARGRQLIVVGDSKQLPPTNFFGRSGDTDEDEGPITEDTVEELESILDECLAAQLPELSLKWHYRSQHESLITFSNFHYYENRLFTFPAADDRRHVKGISHVHVPDGVYETGKTRHNKKEAEAVVADVVRRLLNEKERVRSVGVVTFSQAQMLLIETLLDEARRKHPEIEPYFADSAREKVFVKNLENVQGDERDVIIFSVCYGPDQVGKVSMNFGPLNRVGGERRLNVAVTRARQQLVVYSTLQEDQIDLKRTRAVGAQHLKAFLGYAKRGPKAMAQAISLDPSAKLESPFEERVHAMLQDKGWELEPQVGCSGYRIDLAVRDRDRQGHFLAGVECDGAYYHSAKTARDRDRLRQSVLESLGWKLLRIWSTDFWIDPQGVIDRIDAELTQLQDAARRDEKTLVGANAPVTVSASAPEPPQREAERSEASSTRSSSSLGQRPLPPAEAQPKPFQGLARQTGAQAGIGTETYQIAVLPGFLGADDDFYAAAFDAAIQQCIEAVLATEAPVHRTVLARRVIAPFTLERVTARVLTRIDSLLKRAGLPVSDEFVHGRSMDLMQWKGLRVPSDDPETARKADEIHAAELANAAIFLLEQNISMEREELLREMAAVFGIRRVTANIITEMQRGFRRMIIDGRAYEQGERVVLND